MYDSGCDRITAQKFEFMVKNYETYFFDVSWIADVWNVQLRPHGLSEGKRKISSGILLLEWKKNQKDRLSIPLDVNIHTIHTLNHNEYVLRTDSIWTYTDITARTHNTCYSQIWNLIILIYFDVNNHHCHTDIAADTRQIFSNGKYSQT